MNKRIRKKQLKRTLNGLFAAYDEYEAAWKRIFREAQQDLVDAYKNVFEHTSAKAPVRHIQKGQRQAFAAAVPLA